MKCCCAEKVEDYFELSQAGTAEQDVKTGCEDEGQHLPAVQHDCCSIWLLYYFRFKAVTA
jgi:hypothetical protein